MVAGLMRIKLEDVGKRYRADWILARLNLQLNPNGRYAVTGPNGSGKSTLLKILSGHLTPSKGSITFYENETVVPADQVYKYLAYSAPYIDLIEELSLWEALQFQYQFKPFLSDLEPEDIYRRLNFKKAKRKAIRHFSSGMKQRLKLILSICADTPLLLLDEPTTNLDQEGINWYRSLIDEFTSDRLLVIASNADVDFDFCEHRINILEYKK
jgi:ABC-2 type transport system ATP-binding protein